MELSCQLRSISEVEIADAARFVGGFGSAPKLDRLAQPRIVINENRKMCLIIIAHHSSIFECSNIHVFKHSLSLWRQQVNAARYIVVVSGSIASIRDDLPTVVDAKCRN